MRKFLAVLVVLACLAVPAYAVQTDKTVIDAEAFTSTVDFIEADVNISESKRVTFFTNWDRTPTTACATATVTAAMSVDGSHWEDISWIDVAGGLTPQTSEVLGADGIYIGYIDPIVIAPYIRIGVWFAGDETTSSGTITVDVIEDK